MWLISIGPKACQSKQNRPSIGVVNEPNPITIKTIRELRGLSQRELGRRLGDSSGYVSRVEAGDIKPRRKMCAHMAEILDVDVRALLTGVKA